MVGGAASRPVRGVAVARRHDGAGVAAGRREPGVAQNGRGTALVRASHSREATLAEIGSAPGGASQALLARGLDVLGIDPAEMHPSVAAHPRFRHIRRRAAQVPRREFRKVRWLTADMNVAPNFTLDAVEGIVTHAEVHVRGLLLTLKLPEWSLAEHIPEYLDRVRSWGYNLVHARQLQHDRREFCVAALQRPFRRG